MVVIGRVLLPVKLDALSSEWGNLRGVLGGWGRRVGEKGTAMLVSMYGAMMAAILVASTFHGWSWW